MGDSKEVTGTGNSLTVAKRLNGELVSIPQVMKESLCLKLITSFQTLKSMKKFLC